MELSPLPLSSSGTFPIWQPYIDQILDLYEVRKVGGKAVCVASDTAGDHGSSRHSAMSFFIFDIEQCRNWHQQRAQLRNQQLADGRRISFKKLKDRRRWNIQIPFLRAANTIPGLLASVVANREVKGLLTFPGFAAKLNSAGILKATWKTHDLERMMRMTYFMSYFVSKVIAPKQNIIWLSDQDSVFANEAKTQDTLAMASRWFSKLIPFGLGKLECYTTEADPGDRVEEDLVAVPDLVSGALCDLITAMERGHEQGLRAVSSLTCKARSVVSWLMLGHRAFQVINIVFESPGRGKVTAFGLDLLEGGYVAPRFP